MNKLDIFSQNLRRECARFESIAVVCRLADINRQQFNKYLAGKSLPSAVVLRKLCATLKVQESTLFTEPFPVDGQVAVNAPILTMEKLLKDFGGASLTVGVNDDNIPLGNYFCYFILPHLPGMIVRAFIQVKKTDWGLGFTRITVLPSGRNNAPHLAKGRHKGIILSNSFEHYLIGINRYAPNQISFMSVERNMGSKDGHFTGLAVTRVGNATLTAKFCFVPISHSLKMKDVLKSLGLVHQKELLTDAYVMVNLLQ